MSDDLIESVNVKTLATQLSEKQISRREFVRYASLLGVGAPVAYALASKISGVPFISPARAASLPKGGTFRLGTRIMDAKSPHTYSWDYPANLSRQVLEYLTITDHKSVTHGYLLKSWKASSDLKTWTLNINRKAKWNDGTPLTADQVIWNLKHALDPKVGSSMVGLMKDYMLAEFDEGEKDDKGNPKKTLRLWDANAIQKKDDFTIILNCKAAQIAIPEHLFHYPMGIQHPDENGVFQVGSKGTGAFTLEEFELGRRALLKSRKDYWGGPVALDAMEQIDVGDDPNAPIGMLTSKQIDGLAHADPTQWNALSKLAHLQSYQAATAMTAVMRMRTDVQPFTDARVRLAMKLGVDSDKMVQLALRGLGSVGEHHHVSPAHPEYAKLPKFKRDVAQARKLLAEAGHKNGFETTVDVAADNQWEEHQALAAAEQWKEIGVNVKVNVMPGATYWDVWTKVPFGSTIWYSRPLGTMVLALAYKSNVPWNESGYSNKEFDKILGQAEGTLDVEKRRKLMAQLETIMQKDGPIVQPVFVNALAFMDKRVKGYQLHPMYYVFGWQLGIEKA
ncbi:MAG: ABC transporter substrate-binding protein [Candidatus Symbiobacter sp.]|nr:ABC transporter substrate-binding protein [Candidatus Symbiobacter sp.]